MRDARDRLARADGDLGAFEVLQRGGEAALFDQRLEEVALRGEVVVDGGVGDAGGLGDVADAGAGEALLGEEAERGVEDLLAGERAAPQLPLTRLWLDGGCASGCCQAGDLDSGA